MPHPTSPQFDALWTATYSPTGGNTHPNPRAAQRVYDFRQDFRRYGNRYSELSERGQQHVNIAINQLASHGGGHGRTGTEIASILRDEPQPFDDADEGYFLADPSGGGEWVGDTHSGLPGDEFDYEDQNVRGPDYSQSDPFDRSNPVEDRQARAIEDMNETLGE